MFIYYKCQPDNLYSITIIHDNKHYCNYCCTNVSFSCSYNCDCYGLLNHLLLSIYFLQSKGCKEDKGT